LAVLVCLTDVNVIIHYTVEITMRTRVA